MRKTCWVSEDGLKRLLDSLEAADVYAVVRRERGPEFCNLRRVPDATLALGDERPSASPKSFLQPVRERVAVYSVAGAGEAGPCPACEARALVGLRACDLKAMSYLDKVFREGDVADPFYEARRRAEVLLTVDCVQVHENCFCSALGGRPFVEEGFDLNLTPLASGYLVEVGSEKGQAIIDKAGSAAAAATEAQVKERDALRRKAVERLDRQTTGLRVSEKIAEILLAKQDSPEWARHAGDCVECAACTFICPTCHCFYLYDQPGGGETFDRIRTWDSCLLGDHARMAGPAGAKPNPRARLRSRFANRVLHKFAFSPQQYGLLGCTGCGRCIEACFGKIDLRQMLKELSGDASR